MGTKFDIQSFYKILFVKHNGIPQYVNLQDALFFVALGGGPTKQK